MQPDPWFELTEQHAFTGSTSWRLKGGHICFRGRNSSDERLPAVQPIPAAKERIDDFIKSLDFLDVWRWRRNYSPDECGFVVMDGMSWTFTGSIGGREIDAGGSNAYPSFADVAVPSLESERYTFLLFALHRSFGIPLPDDFFRGG
ncbi:MAG: hypothetical protein AAFX06_32770 [Planctomycetota bacterium]